MKMDELQNAENVQEIDIDIPQMDDPKFTLGEWKKRIEGLIDTFGEKPVLYTDAGYNNVSMKLKTEVEFVEESI